MPSLIHCRRFAILPMALLVACTSIPRSNTPDARLSQLNCGELDSEVALNAESRRIATQARADAWHVVLPILVGVRYVHASSALSDVDSRAAKLDEARKLKACTGS